MSIEIRGLRAEEYPQLLEMLPRVMSAPRTYFAACYRHDPEARSEHSRVVIVDGEIVSHIRLYDRWQRVGGVPVHVGCVGDVCTLPEHRRRGYCRALLEDALAYWDDQEYDLSMIVSGVGVYERCGWVTFPEMAYRAQAADLASSSGGYAVRRFARAEDLDAVAAVHEAYHEGRSLATVRTRAYWERHFYWITGEREEAFLVATSGDEIVAYVRGRHGGDRLIISECCHQPEHPQAVSALCEASFTLAHRAGCRAVEAVLPDDHPAVAFYAERPAWLAEERAPLLFRLVDLPRLLRRLEPLLTERLCARRYTGSGARPAGPRVEAGPGVDRPARTRGADLALSLRVADQEAGLAITPEGVRVVPPSGTALRLAPAEFFMLLFGQASASELTGLATALRAGPAAPRTQPDTEATSDTRALLAALFPRGAPIYWRTDIV
jgi:predicted N-acetyltransferase YhbS